MLCRVILDANPVRALRLPYAHPTLGQLAPPCRNSPIPFSTLAFQRGQDEAEDAAYSWFAFNPHPAVMFFYHCLDNSQA